MNQSDHFLPNQNSRRQLLKTAACGFGSLALAGLTQRKTNAASSGIGSANPLSEKVPHLPQRAKRVIFIFMQGGPSQVDSFDYKPRLKTDDGKKVEFKVARTRKVTPERVFDSPWKFKQYGECGQWVSELFPEMAKFVDDACLIKSMHTEGVAHGPSTLFLHTGATNLIRPSIGSWITYGLGTENQNLPGFVTICPAPTKGGPRNYGNAFLPTSYQGSALGRAGQSMKDVAFQYVNNSILSREEQRARFEMLRRLNSTQLKPNDDELEATIASYELAWRMQAHAPNVVDIGDESAATLDMYGINKKPTDEFGRQCLSARRLAEAGVRYIQVNYSDTGNTPRWDQHSNIMKHADHARAVDKPVAGLLQDLKQRGLLDDTLVWWGGEFGRTPFAQNRDGRDHNPNGFTVWLSGGGVKHGMSFGETDEFGYNAVQNKVHMHDLHATILHLMGLDHTRLTHRHAGRDFRLTDVHGRVVKEIFA